MTAKRDLKRRVRQRQRDEQLPPPEPMPSGPFELIYADPPWRLPGNPDSSRAVESHYPTMSLEEILSLQVPAAENANAPRNSDGLDGRLPVRALHLPASCLRFHHLQRSRRRRCPRRVMD